MRVCTSGPIEKIAQARRALARRLSEDNLLSLHALITVRRSTKATRPAENENPKVPKPRQPGERHARRLREKERDQERDKVCHAQFGRRFSLYRQVRTPGLNQSPSQQLPLCGLADAAARPSAALRPASSKPCRPRETTSWASWPPPTSGSPSVSCASRNGPPGGAGERSSALGLKFRAGERTGCTCTALAPAHSGNCGQGSPQRPLSRAPHLLACAPGGRALPSVRAGPAMRPSTPTTA